MAWNVLSCIAFLGCVDNHAPITKHRTKESIQKDAINDSAWVKNKEYAYGDIRRYGFVNKTLSQIQLDSIMELADQGIKIVFPSGSYPIDFNIHNRENIKFHFNGSTITGKLSLHNAQNIEITGDLEILDILFLRDSKQIVFENISVSTDIDKCKSKKANRGVNIYSGCNNISFDKLNISNFGGEGDFFAYAHAALMIHGFENTPENIRIKNILIENSKRTGAYISGKNHGIGRIEVVNYGLSNRSMDSKPVEKASIGEEKIYSGIWMNLTENNSIDTLIVRNQKSMGNYSVIFDESLGTIPNIIKTISLSDPNIHKTDYNSNILVLNEF